MNVRLCVCIETIFADREMADRIDAVAEAGIAAFEIWGWRDKNLEVLQERSRARGVDLENMNVDPLICVIDGGRDEEFLRAVRESCQAANSLGCPRLVAHVDSVEWEPGEPWYAPMSTEAGRELHLRQRDHAVRALKRAASVAEAEGVTLLVEPLNTIVDHGGFFVSSSKTAFDIVREVDSPALRVLFDVYHQQITEGNLTRNLTENIDLVGHIHLADVPGRHEPGTGEINFPNLLRAVVQAGYQGCVGLEYVPSGDHDASLDLIREVVRQVDVV
jgi:hydroxypyruvate isomerase